MKILLIKLPFMNLIDTIFNGLYGKKSFQKLFWKIFHFSLKGLNFNIVGSGEVNVLAFLNNKLPKNPVLFDVGANKGDYTKDLIKKFPGGEIHSFEPIPSTFNLLESINLPKGKLNKLGLGAKKEKVKMFYYPDAPTFSSLKEISNNNLHHEECEVEITTIDSYCNENAIPHIDFIKIDVEGFEMAVLEGAKNYLTTNKISAIQFEFGSNQVISRNFFKDFYDLLSPNFKLYRILNDGFEEISKYESKHEIFRYSNYFALNRSFK